VHGKLVEVANRLAHVLRLSLRRARPEEYVATDHPAGELRLRLDPDGRFALGLAVWDPVVRTVAGHRQLRGEWRESAGTLELRSATRELVYRRSPPRRGFVASLRYALDPGAGELGATRAVLIWERSNLPTFADGVTLGAVSATRRTPPHSPTT
jgi:hypothetical protein